MFEVDAFGEAHEIADGWVSSTLEGKAWLARANCPELAIEIECAGELA
jgi:ferredoxin